jgi:hypothetical protein
LQPFTPEEKDGGMWASISRQTSQGLWISWISGPPISMGPLYRVRVAHRRLIAPQEFSFIEGELRLN